MSVQIEPIRPSVYGSNRLANSFICIPIEGFLNEKDNVLVSKEKLETDIISARIKRTKFYRKLSKLSSNIFKVSNKDFLSNIKDHYKKNNKTIVIDEVFPIIDDYNFIDLVTKDKIPFTSVKDPHIAEKLSSILIYLGEKKGVRKAGNPKGGDNYKNKANDFAKSMQPILQRIDEAGLKSFAKKAHYLNENNIKSILNKKWSPSAVRNVWLRCQGL